MRTQFKLRRIRQNSMALQMANGEARVRANPHVCCSAPPHGAGMA